MFKRFSILGMTDDATATPLASFDLIMAAEAVETSATTNFPPEISTSISFLIDKSAPGKTYADALTWSVPMVSKSR